MFTPVDFHHDMARLRRQLNHAFRDFDSSFAFRNDPFFPLVATQPMALQGASAPTEQKESGQLKQGSAATNNQMAVEPATNNALRPWGWGGDSLFPSALNNAVTIPRMDVVENADNFLLKCDLPGMSKNDVKVSINDGLLSINAEHSEKHEQKDENTKFHRVERSYGKYMRSIQLPDNVDADAVKASQENGMLQITLPKKPKQEPKQAKQVPIL